jgi:methionyl-tRNA formyltransferase
MRVVFCGTGDIGVPTLRALLDSSRHDVAGVITQPDKPAGRDLKPHASAIKLLAIEREISVHQPSKIRSPESMEALNSMRPDIMVVVAYGQILPVSVLQIPKFGCLNLHASLLPRYRGAAPIQAAILSGDQETGMTVMYMDEGLDTGDILLMVRTPIGLSDTAGELHDRLAEIGAPALMEALELLEVGAASRTSQDSKAATHVGKLKKTDGLLDWHEPASQLALRVRAMSPWPGAFARLGGQTLKIHEACVSAQSGMPGQILAVGIEGITIAAGVAALTLKTIQLEGRKRLPAGDFLRGHPLKVGDSLDLSFPPAP